MQLDVQDFFRFIFTLVFSFTITAISPIIGLNSPNIFLPVALVFSFLISFFINRALDRKKIISSAVSVEISRLRRIHHLSDLIGDTIWRESIQFAIRHYQKELGADFLNYHLKTKYFREFSRLIYSYDPRNAREQILFNELLVTMREIALERQLIGVYITQRLPQYSWLVICSVAFFLIALLIMVKDTTLVTQIGISFGVASILFILDLLKHTDRISKTERRTFQNWYKENISHL